MKKLKWNLKHFASLAIAMAIVACGDSKLPLNLKSDSADEASIRASADKTLRQIDPQLYVTMLYQAILWRTPDFPGANGYVQQVRSNGLKGLRDAGNSISRSNEFATRVFATHNADQILDRLYTLILGRQTNPQTGRPVDPAGIAAYTNYIINNQTYVVVDALLTSLEFSKRVNGLPSGTTVPGPTPTPTIPPVPGPTPIITPVPTPVPTGGGCTIPILPESAYTGVRNNSSVYLNLLDATLNEMISQRPDLFNLNDQPWPGSYFVNNDDLFYAELTRRLQQKGYCTGLDGGEVQIQTPNARWDESFQVVISNRHLRRGIGSYRATWSW